MAHEVIEVRRSVATRSDGFGGDAVLSALLFLRTSITPCAINGFSSILQRWNPLTEGYNSVMFDFYHNAVLVCVLEYFNCMLLGG